MILKFDRVEGPRLAEFLQFVHSKENEHYDPLSDRGHIKMIVCIKSVSSITVQGSFATRAVYVVTVEMDETPHIDKDGSKARTDPKFILKAYDLLGQQ